jgi:hypothetical protein
LKLRYSVIYCTISVTEMLSACNSFTDHSGRVV